MGQQESQLQKQPSGIRKQPSRKRVSKTDEEFDATGSVESSTSRMSSAYREFAAPPAPPPLYVTRTSQSNLFSGLDTPSNGAPSSNGVNGLNGHLRSLDPLAVANGTNHPAAAANSNGITEVELRIVHNGEETSIGFIDVDSADSLARLRHKMLSELDHVPETFVFLRDGRPLGIRQEAAKGIREAVLLDGVVRISVEDPSAIDNDRLDTNLAMVSPKREPAQVFEFSSATAAATLAEAARVYREVTGKSEDLGRRILVIYTGGTIGMAPTANGFAPVSGVLFNFLRTQAHFHDANIPVVNGVLTTPPSRLGKRSQYMLQEFNPLLDSSNMGIAEWMKIASAVQANYETFDSFVILHGTDTMAYSASALSFMLENLQKTVILTGSQVPLTQPQNDAVDNFLGAMCLAGAYEIPEVLLYFNAKLMRGNRTTKGHSEAFNAFVSPNFPPLATVGTHIHVAWDAFISPSIDAPFRVQTSLNPNIACLRLFPGISRHVMARFLEAPMAGVILQTFGSGNAPDNDAEFLAILREACDRGVVIVNCTQCMRGTVSAEYATGTQLLKCGVVPGYDMTVEAALAKLAYLLGKGLPPTEVRKLMMTNARGELTPEEDHGRFSFKDSNFVRGVAHALRVTDQSSVRFIAQSLGPVLLCSAAEAGDLKEVAQLVRDGLSASACDYDRRTPLHLAAATGQVRVAEYLIKQGANVNALDRWGKAPLNEAVMHEREDMINLLLNSGARINLPTKEIDLVSLLCNAASKGNVALLDRLHRCGCDLNVADYDGRTALHLAAAEGQTEAVLCLLAHGARTDLRDRWGNSALDEAHRCGRTELLEPLSKPTNVQFVFRPPIIAPPPPFQRMPSELMSPLLAPFTSPPTDMAPAHRSMEPAERTIAAPVPVRREPAHPLVTSPSITSGEDDDALVLAHSSSPALRIRPAHSSSADSLLGSPFSAARTTAPPASASRPVSSTAKAPRPTSSVSRTSSQHSVSSIGSADNSPASQSRSRSRSNAASRQRAHSKPPVAHPPPPEAPVPPKPHGHAGCRCRHCHPPEEPAPSKKGHTRSKSTKSHHSTGSGDHSDPPSQVRT